VLAARREAVTPELVADFIASKKYGMANISDIADGAALKLDLPSRSLERYLRENIDFWLDAENIAGLELYYKLCAEAGLIDRAKPIEFALPNNTFAGANLRNSETGKLAENR
jgi:predicted solute-binding protein